MSADGLIDDLRTGGFRVQLTADGLTVSPRSALTDGHRSAIRANRDALLSILRREAKVTEGLFAAINRCCDARGDEEANRAALVEECSALPTADQAAWRAYFEGQAEAWARPEKVSRGSADGS